MLENTRADDTLRNLKPLFSAMERQTDSSIVGTLSRVQALVSETVSMVRAQREDIGMVWQKWESQISQNKSEARLSDSQREGRERGGENISSRPADLDLNSLSI